jgi:hypothetical protein
LRWMGRRHGQERMHSEGIPGDVVMLPFEAGWRGRPIHMARLLKPGTGEELLPSLIDARVVGVRRSLLIAGIEQVPQGRKGVERYPQTWLCSHERIPDIHWAAMPRPTATSATGFDPSDDDAA